MEISKTTGDDGITLALSGKLSADNAEKFELAVEAALAELETDGKPALTLDFRELSYLASAGLQALVLAQKKLTARSGVLAIINVCSDVRKIFEITGLDAVLSIRRSP
jgi:anti-anti-sigma factor